MYLVHGGHVLSGWQHQRFESCLLADLYVRPVECGLSRAKFPGHLGRAIGFRPREPTPVPAASPFWRDLPLRTFTQQPVSVSLYPGPDGAIQRQRLQFATNLSMVVHQSEQCRRCSSTDGTTHIAGSQTTSLTDFNVASGNAGTYALIATGPGGGFTTSAAATLTMLSPGPSAVTTITDDRVPEPDGHGLEHTGKLE